MQTCTIWVKSITGKVLTFKGVTDYVIQDGFMTFTDKRTGERLGYPLTACEIREEVLVG